MSNSENNIKFPYSCGDREHEFLSGITFDVKTGEMIIPSLNFKVLRSRLKSARNQKDSCQWIAGGCPPSCLVAKFINKAEEKLK